MKEPASLPDTGFVKIDTILKVLPVGRSTFWTRVKTGEYPRPVKFGHRTVMWKVEDIRALLTRLAEQGSQN